MLSRTRALAASCAVALALSGALSGCDRGGDGDGDDVASPSPSASSASRTPSPAPTVEATTPSATSAVAVYYLRDTGPAGPRLYREFHARPRTGDPVRDAVEAMLTIPPDDDDYSSLWPSGVEVLDARVEGDLATVDLSARAGEGSAGAAFEGASVQQLVHTVTAANTAVSRVQLLVDGQRRESLWGHVDIRQPISRQPQEQVLGPIWVVEPGEGGSVPRGGEVTGVATVFEATVSWQWRQGEKVVAEGFSTATEGAPGRGEWTATADVAPGEYVFRAFSESAEDGSEMFVDDKRVTVTG